MSAPKFCFQILNSFYHILSSLEYMLLKLENYEEVIMQVQKQK